MPKKKNETKIEITIEQKRQNDLNSFLKERSKFIPEPTYKYEIGDRVEIGNLQDVYVCDIINDRIYEINYSYTDNNYGNPIKYTDQKRFVAWYDIRPYIENQSKSIIKNNDIRLSYSQNDIGSLFSKVYYFGTDFDPEYQREYVWELEDKIALIDSIFNNVDIGKFAFIHKGYDDKYIYEILDGKQRIRAILDFFENRFAYNGLYFNDLCNRDKNHFEYYPLSVAEVRESDRKQILKYFVKLNKHGKIMDKKQIEKVEKMIEEFD